MEGGNAILAQADGSSGPDFFRRISSITVTESPLLSRPMTSPLSPAWPRTLTLLAITTAGPATRGTVRRSSTAVFFALRLFVFFLPIFFEVAFAVVFVEDVTVSAV